MTHPAQLPIEILLTECEFQRTRRSGPGGQHRNKVETAVVVKHVPSAIRAEANERRSQEQNRKEAIRRLRTTLAVEVRTPPSIELSEIWQARSRGGRLTVSAEHDDFPALLAESLDRIAAEEFDLRLAAEKLGVSSSQLVKLLKLDPAALAVVNRERQQRGQAPYR